MKTIQLHIKVAQKSSTKQKKVTKRYLKSIPIMLLHWCDVRPTSSMSYKPSSYILDQLEPRN